MGARRTVWARLGVATLLALSGCATRPALVKPPTVMARQEIPLPPPPPRALTVGVYSCIDTSGQRRPTQLPQELSTAVPMDCTPYLIDAVRSLRPGYVYLVERQHVDELLRERQLATLALNSMPEPAAGGVQEPAGSPAAARKLYTLRVAEILLVGQVVAYDRSTREIKAGAAVGAVGASGTYVTDLVTFSLRAVAVQTGEVLGQTTVTKSVNSLAVGGHITKIYSTSVLDLEAGGSANEPVGLALGSAVRSALTQLVDQGIHDGWWS
ncbi:CsgG/HfaB family protein [Caulobacter sp.]|uniref:CsgG/HfaB family protein n=1 Tax=Caulobacter sp. TaxID=78 RepID=UPI002B46576C|nr:CsgG/HfaB family protein [Caulobacter sp.]HJV40528.1 CsgG/HfaB family protein [Caulobacter sp.]